MLNKKSVVSEIDLVSTLKTISQAYQEISVMKMQKIRHSVLYTREYLNQLAQLFYDVKQFYKFQMQLKKNKKKEPIKKNGKSAIVLLSANTKLYGDIVSKVSRKFLEYVKGEGSNQGDKVDAAGQGNDDIIVVGKLGREFIETNLPGKKYQYFDIPDNDISLNDLSSLAQVLVPYENVTIFYGQFENVIRQNPVATNISGGMNIIEETTVHVEKKFLFEPQIEDIMAFFESQIVSSLMKQTINESQLSRYASRIVAMEEALTNIETRSKMLYSDKRRLEKMINNKKQIETISGVALWFK